MKFKDIFAEYYTLFRGDSDIPDPTDPEWAIGVRFANTALRRLQEVDGEDWDWLWTTAVAEGETNTYTNTSTEPITVEYDGPSNMLRPGGWVKLSDPNNPSYNFKVDIIPDYNVQRMATAAPYAYWTGDANTGYVLHLNLQGNSYSDYIVDFPYYKQVTMFDAATGSNGGVAESGSTVTECPDANFLINYMLAYRFRATRNYPSYQIAKKDAETALQGMQVKNRKGVDGHSWNLTDTSSGSFGV